MLRVRVRPLLRPHLVQSGPGRPVSVLNRGEAAGGAEEEEIVAQAPEEQGGAGAGGAADATCGPIGLVQDGGCSTQVRH